MDGAKLLWVRLGQFWLVGAAIGAPGSGRRDIHFVSIMTRQVTIDWGHVERASTARLPIALYYQCPVQNDFTRRQAVRLEGCSTITASRLRRYVFCFQLDGRSHTRTQLAEAYKRRGGGIILCSFPRCEGRIPDHAACDAPRYIPRSSASCSEHYPKTAAKITIFGPCEESPMSDSMSADPKPQNVKLQNIIQATADLQLKLPSQVLSGHFQALVGRRSLSCAWGRHPKARDGFFLSNSMETVSFC
jgi:hypothetical protein